MTFGACKLVEESRPARVVFPFSNSELAWRTQWLKALIDP